MSIHYTHVFSPSTKKQILIRLYVLKPGIPKYGEVNFTKDLLDDGLCKTISTVILMYV